MYCFIFFSQRERRVCRFVGVCYDTAVKSIFVMIEHVIYGQIECQGLLLLLEPLCDREILKLRHRTDLEMARLF